MSQKKVAFVSLGCAKNLINTEQMMAIAQKNGWDICQSPTCADVVVINTCGFIEDAKKEALETIFDAVRLKNDGTIQKIIVCGCLAERYKSEIASELYEVDGFVGVGSFDKIAKALSAVYQNCRPEFFESTDKLMLEGNRIITTPSHYAYIKLSDGCDNRCSYCAIPDIRGALRSRPIENILNEAADLVKKGVRELILIAQDTTSYGIDLYGTPRLTDLLHRLCRLEGDFEIRLMYLYPHKIDRPLINTIKCEPKIMKYIEMPVQHASGSVLTRMNRKGDINSLLSLVRELRAQIPGVVLRSTVMVGFPGESEQEFSELCEFVRTARLERLGIFIYSREKGTLAFSHTKQVPCETALRRLEILQTIAAGITEQINAGLEGKILSVVIDDAKAQNGMYPARSYMEAPEIDGCIYINSKRELKSGDMLSVRIRACEFELIGDEISHEYT